MANIKSTDYILSFDKGKTFVQGGHNWRIYTVIDIYKRYSLKQRSELRIYFGVWSKKGFIFNKYYEYEQGIIIERRIKYDYCKSLY